jgi:archaeosortase B (VPXXXP-CTERM-specific)
MSADTIEPVPLAGAPDPNGRPRTGHPALWAGLTFVALLVVLQLPLIFVGPRFWEFTNEWTARLTAWSLALTGVPARAEGRVVTSSLVGLEIIRECTAVYPLLIYTSAVLAFPARWRMRLAGLALGWPALLVVNQMRLVSLCWIAWLAPEHFESAHLLVWQSLIAAATVLAFLLWVTRALRAERAART